MWSGVVTNVGVKLNQSSGFADAGMTMAATSFDWTTVGIDVDGDGNADTINPETSLPTGVTVPSSLTISGDTDFTGKLLRVNGTIASLSLFGFVTGKADFGLSIQEVDVDLGGGGFGGTGDLTDATLLQFGLNLGVASPTDDLEVSVLVGGVGITADAGALGIASLSSNATDDSRNWLAVKAVDVGASLVGLPDVVGVVTNVGVKLNQSSGFADAGMTMAATSLDWMTVGIDVDGDGNADTINPETSLPTGVTVPSSLTISGDTDFTGKLLRVNGTIASLSLFGFVTGKADFGLSIQEVDVDLGGGGFGGTGDLTDATLLQFGLNLGVASPTDDLEVSVLVGGVGITADAGALGIASLSSNATDDTRNWLAVKAVDVGASLVGLPDVVGVVTNVGVKLNQSSGFADAGMTMAATSFDWTTVGIDVDGDGNADTINPETSLPTGVTVPSSLTISGDTDFTGKLLRGQRDDRKLEPVRLRDG